MYIRKLFEVESSHVVRDCFSRFCSHSVHGHSAKIEVMLSGSKLDNAGMLYDFGLMKGTIKQFINSMDHCHLIWNKDKQEYIDFFKKNNERWIELPFNPTAEQLSMFVHRFVQLILDHTKTANGEADDLKVVGVSYHETSTGYAHCDENDVKTMFNDEWLDQITFSPGVIAEWSDALKSILLNDQTVINYKSEPKPY